MKATSGTATTHAQEFLESSRVFLNDDFLPKLLFCLERLSDEDIWWRPNESSNSVGNLILHLCGNVRQWIVASLCGIRFDRNRDLEFTSRGSVSKTELIANIRDAVGEATRILDELTPDVLLRRHPVQTYDVSSLQAVYHVVEHFSYHLGQIIYIYKMKTDADPAFYRF